MDKGRPDRANDPIISHGAYTGHARPRCDQRPTRRGSRDNSVMFVNETNPALRSNMRIKSPRRS